MPECASARHHPNPFRPEGGASQGLPVSPHGMPVSSLAWKRAVASRALLEGQRAARCRGSDQTPISPRPRAPSKNSGGDGDTDGTRTCQCHDDKPLSCVAVATLCGLRGGRRGCGAALPYRNPGDCTEMLSWAAGSCLQPLWSTRLTLRCCCSPSCRGRCYLQEGKIHGRGVTFGAQEVI